MTSYNIIISNQLVGSTFVHEHPANYSCIAHVLHTDVTSGDDCHNNNIIIMNLINTLNVVD